jgi:hypothetical protein
LTTRSPFRVAGGGLQRVWPLVACLLLLPHPSLADPAGGSSLAISADAPLTTAVRRAIAERFAPTLVFHGSERYFPTSPLFPVEQHIHVGDDPAGEPSLTTQLGTADERRLYYESLTQQEKEALARVFYRVYDSRVDDEPVVVIEYWLYYVQNTYRVRGNLFPVWVSGNHPNDLEHVHVVVRRGSDGNYALHEVYGSAHTGTMPANRHRFGADEALPLPRPRFIVELGSHANAPDINADGLFTPGEDGASGYKMVWGIRDRGITWARYSSKYMEQRTEANSIVFDYADDTDAASAAHFRYALVPVDDLSTEFRRLDLDRVERRALFEKDGHWFRRMFGGDNGSSEKLLAPPVRLPTDGGIGFPRFASTERGYLVGTQLNLEQQGVFAGARYAYLTGPAFVPDLVLEADGIVTRHQQYVSAQMLAAYPIDGSTKVMAGKAIVTDARRPARRQWDWIAAIEFPVGHMRVYVASRSWGPITRFSKEVRLSYFF